MPQFDIDRPRPRLKALGVLLASFVALVSMALLLVTHEPKKAESSPSPVKALVLPQIADAKSEAEIIFRGKSFSVFQRRLVFPYGGEIQSIEVKEGQVVNDDDTLVKYKLDRQAIIQVMGILYPAQVLDLKKALYDQKINLDKLNNVTLKIQNIELGRVSNDLSNVRQLHARKLAELEAVRISEQKLETLEKQILETKKSIRQIEEGISRTEEDLNFFEGKRKRDLDLLEYQTKRSYENSDLPIETAFIKAPITGQVLWMSPDLRVNAEQPTGFLAMTIAPTNPMVVRCKVHELDLVKLKTGDRGTVIFDAIPDKKFPCKVNRIPWVSRNPALEVPADYEIECLLENSDGKIKDGLTCNVRVTVTQ